jgi:hypothetical protein
MSMRRLSLLADLQARNNDLDAARQTLDAALIAAEAHDDLWWLPEVMRMRAAYDEEQAAVSRLRAAAQTASARGSVALLRRCEHDLAGHEVRPPRSWAFPPRPDASATDAITWVQLGRAPARFWSRRTRNADQRTPFASSRAPRPARGQNRRDPG